MPDPASGRCPNSATVLVHTSCGELCIINVYMPCRGSRDSEDNYKDVLMQVREIMNTYASSARFILVGDMNASLVREVPTVRDTVFRKFCESHCLSIGENILKRTLSSILVATPVHK